jgi:hypothetical protein
MTVATACVSMNDARASDPVYCIGLLYFAPFFWPCDAGVGLLKRD